MRIRTRLILGFLSIAVLTSFSGYIDIQYGRQIKQAFTQIEREEIPSLNHLLELTAVARQASIKAMEFSARGNPEDRQKSEEAILKVKGQISSYNNIEIHVDDTKKAHLIKVADTFIFELDRYLNISDGSAKSSIVTEEAELHQARKKLIIVINQMGIADNNTPLSLYYEKIKSEARKISVKAIEYHLRGSEKDRLKTSDSIETLNTLAKELDNSTSDIKSSTYAIQDGITHYISIAEKFLDTISDSQHSLNEIYKQEKSVHQARRALIHTLYPLIQSEYDELAKAESIAHDAIAGATRVAIISAVLATATALFLGFYLARSISKPVIKLTMAAQEIGSGNLDSKIDISTHDEIGDLANSFKHMSCDLKNARNDLLKTNAILENEMTDKNHLFQELQHRNMEMEQHQEALLNWAKVDYLNLEHAIRSATEISANTIGASRVSVWLYTSDQRAIICKDLYIRDKGVHESGLLLQASEYPSYFKALNENRTLAITDARSSPETREFTNTYLEPLGITSMMDVPIRREGQIIGVVCHEHTGPIREWSLEEQDFAASISSTVSLALEADKRKKAELLLQAHLDELEVIVDKRTAELKSVNQELDSFSYSVSHDLRSPLRAINGFSKALMEDYAEQLDTTAKDYLNRIGVNASRMSQLIDDLLKLSRLNQESLNVKPINLSLIATSILDDLIANSPDRDVSINVHDTEMTTCDPDLIRVALQNLLDNAWKYTANTMNATIEFGMIHENFENIYFVKDNGAGFDMDYASKLFGAFQRLHGKEFEGTGIGLATVQRVIHRHGGRIWADANIDTGATFYFTLGNQANLQDTTIS